MNFIVKKLRGLVRDESGAVTVDWVALTAGILLLGIAVVFAIFSEGVDPLVNNIANTLSGQAQNLNSSLVDTSGLVDDLTNPGN